MNVGSTFSNANFESDQIRVNFVSSTTCLPFSGNGKRSCADEPTFN